MTTTFLKSPGLFLVFWQISIMLLFGWSPLVCYFQVLQSLYQSICDCSKSTNYSSYNPHIHVLQFFQFPSKVLVLILLFPFFQFNSGVSRDSKVYDSASFLFFLLLLIITKSGLLAEIRWSVWISISKRSLWVSFFRTDAGLCKYHLLEWSNFSFSTIPNGPFCPTSCVSSNNLSVLLCCICVLCDW